MIQFTQPWRVEVQVSALIEKSRGSGYLAIRDMVASTIIRQIKRNDALAIR